MRKLLTIILILLLASLATTSTSQTPNWGFFAHRLINRNAVFHLPNQIYSFFRSHIVALVNQAVLPDKKRYINPLEAPMHYIDLDAYDSVTLSKWKSDHHYFDSLEKETWFSQGALPYRLLNRSNALTHAFMEQNAEKCIQIAGDLAHYIGDAHVPLHTTSNYDGQKTGQEGIHGLWESRLPELYLPIYDLSGRKAQYIPDLFQFYWRIIEESYMAVDTVLLLERQLAHLQKGQIKGFANRGELLMSDYSRRFVEKYHEGLSGMVERRLRAAIIHTADVWYTCWVDAGQPTISEWEKKDTAPKD